jgi:hypothetical protein
MATDKDFALVQYLLSSTREGNLKWEPTVEDEEFTATIRGKYTVLVSRDGARTFLSLSDESERELLSVTDNEDVSIIDLFDRAKREALSVDSVIDEILGEER